jgi:uncharacterized protein YdaU (DUF1376 family)
MSKMPKMNLWIDAFNSDTSFLTDEELGIYFRLIFFAWGREGYLPKDLEFIVNLTRNKNSNAINKIIKLYWIEDDKGYYQKRLKEEYERAVQMTENAKKSAQSRWGVVKESDSPPNVLKLEHPNATAMRSHSERNASISKSISISKYNINNHFDIFWEKICYKVNKGQARRNYSKLHKDWLEEPEMLAKKYNQYYDLLKDKQYAQHPSTWLNAEGFLNEGITIDEKSDEEMQDWKFKGDVEMRKKGIKPLSWSVGYIRELDEAIAKGDS